MSQNRNRRITKELEETTKDTDANITLRPAGGKSDLTHLEGFFTGPPDTPYQGGQFCIDIKIPNDYPFRPPVMKFTTSIWHPNVSSQTGAICLDTLSTAWSPVLTLKTALISIQGLLASPEPKDPQDAEVAAMLMNDPAKFAQKAKEWSVKFAGAKPNDTDTAAKPESKAAIAAAEKQRQYHGYNEALVNRFCDLGFDIPTVVQALEKSGVEKDPQNSNISETRANEVAGRLFGET